jgi:hypothetical protein
MPVSKIMGYPEGRFLSIFIFSQIVGYSVLFEASESPAGLFPRAFSFISGSATKRSCRKSESPNRTSGAVGIGGPDAVAALGRRRALRRAAIRLIGRKFLWSHHEMLDEGHTNLLKTGEDVSDTGRVYYIIDYHFVKTRPMSISCRSV